MIAAYDRHRAIGKNGRIPWRIPGEQQRFRSLTLGQTVIFGRRTYEEIGVPPVSYTHLTLPTKA